MSQLGIRNVLPYTGANGIKVNGSKIEIDPLGKIYFYDGASIEVANNLVTIDKNGIDLQSLTSGNTTDDLTINSSGIFINNIAGTVQNNITASELQIVNYTNNNYSRILVNAITLADGENINILNLAANILQLNNYDTGQATNIQAVSIAADGGISGDNVSYNGNAQATQIGNIQDEPVSLLTTSYLEFFINGDAYKIALAQ